MRFGKIGHVGIVVKDIQAAKEHYSRLLGIEKWYELVYDDAIDLYYGGVKKDCSVTLYFGGKGHTVIELIQTEGEENTYTTFYKNHGEGIHHIQYDVKNLDEAVKHVEAEGLHVIQNAEFSSGGAKVRYAYVGKSENDVIYELIETSVMPGVKKMDMPLEFKMGCITGSYKRVK